MTRRLNFLLVTMFLLVGGPVWYLLIDTSSGTVEPAALNLNVARQLASEIPGPLPEKVEYEVVSRRRASGNLHAAGSGFKERELGVLAFRLIVPGKPAIMIETGIAPERTAEFGFGKSDPEAQSRIDLALRESAIILATDEHGDHLGGLAKLVRNEPSAGLPGKARLNRHQVPGRSSDSAQFWPTGLQIKPSIASSGAQAIAPGVVAIPAPGHAPGSQMIFVKLANGNEFIFAGDTAPMATSWTEVRPPSRLAEGHWKPADRKSLIGWLKALQLEKQKNRRLTIIPGHDLEWLADPLNRVPVSRMQDSSVQNQAGN